MKGTIIKNFSNIKTMDGSPAPGLAMQIGDYAFGDVSSTGSDLINFDHFYRAGGQRIELGKPCKATASNMSITNETETTTPPPVVDPVPPTGDPHLTHTIQVYSDGTISIDGGPRS